MGDCMCESLRKENITIRKLELADAGPMLEWMLEPDIYKKMQYNPKEQSLEKCRNFIKESWTDKRNLHYAVTNRTGEYLGTVSLKNIDEKNKNAEFAIALHPKAMGKGISAAALDAIMEKAFYDLDLNKVYLYVRSDNERAVAFYRKYRLEYEGCFKEQLYLEGEYKDIYWFALRRSGFERWRNLTGRG